MRLVIALSVLFAVPASAAQHGSWAEYMKTNRYKCPGPFDTLKEARTLTLGGKTYKHEGYKLTVQNPDEDTTIKVGVMSAIKDTNPGTKRNFNEAIAWFKSKGVEWMVVNGDIALEEFDLQEVMAWLANADIPVLVTLGNSESKSSFARVYKDAENKSVNVVNGVWVRQLVLDDVEMWTVPGYHDKRFVHQGAGCIYGKADIDLMLKDLKPQTEAPVMLVSHGPPQGSGKTALDWMADKKNVGDPELARLLRTASIPFGLFGHILEAGGQVVGKDMTTKVLENKSTSALYLNAGSISADPWGLNDGKTTYGLAFIVTIDGKNAQYETKRFAEFVAAE